MTADRRGVHSKTSNHVEWLATTLKAVLRRVLRDGLTDEKYPSYHLWAMDEQRGVLVGGDSICSRRFPRRLVEVPARRVVRVVVQYRRVSLGL